MTKRLLVVDDHDVVRKGVLGLLRGRPDWEVVGEADNGLEAVEKIHQLRPDLVILDISMPGKDGLGVLADVSLMSAATRPKILILTMHNSKRFIRLLEESGAHGYVVKTSAGQDLARAVEKILNGGSFFPETPEPA